MAPRASWKGYLKLSLVSCPIRLYNATTSTNTISFHWLHKDTHNRIQMKPYDPELGPIQRSDIVKGYEFEKDRYVIVSDEDFEKIQIESTKTITIEEFVDAADIDTMFLDSPYYMAPDGPVGEETYRVVQAAMVEQGKAALARVALSGRERQVVITPRDKGFVLTTLRTAAEVRAHDEYFTEIGEGELDGEALKLAKMIISQNAGEFDSAGFEDEYQKALLEIVQAKIKGSEPVVTKAPERGNVINLMDALKRTLDQGALKKPPAASRARAGAETAKPAAKGAGSPAREAKATKETKSGAKSAPKSAHKSAANSKGQGKAAADKPAAAKAAAGKRKTSRSAA